MNSSVSLLEGISLKNNAGRSVEFFEKVALHFYSLKKLLQNLNGTKSKRTSENASKEENA